METKLEYGNWIRRRKLSILGFCALSTGALTFLPLGVAYRATAAILFAVLAISFLVPLYAYIAFSRAGGRFQERLYDLVVRSLGPNVRGAILDIGSGNGVLAVKLAQRHAETHVVGIDYWGRDWEYSKAVCEKNARAAQVEARVHFQKGDAAALTFAGETFDGAISNLTFHEVQSVADKRAVLREALRVVKPGGVFAFVDYFYEEKYYGSRAEFESYLKSLGLSQVDLKPLTEMMAIPVLLKHPKILGKVGAVWGRK